MQRNVYFKLRWKIFFLILWILLVFYPNPMRLFNSIERTINPPVAPEMVSNDLLDDVRGMENSEIEKYILNYIPYQYDWETFNLPWYYPTVDEVLDKRTGDCKSRMILLASVFEAIDREYELRYSVNHFWINYEGKPGGYIERDDVFLYSSDEGFQLPDFQLDVTYRSYNNFMELMPFYKKVLFLAGFFIPPWIEKTTNKQVLDFYDKKSRGPRAKIKKKQLSY